MKFTLTLVTVLLLAPLTALHAADAPSLQPPLHLGPPRADQAMTNRAFTGIPSMAVAPKGRFWATWYAGVTPGEDVNNYVVLSTSGDDGKTWNEVLTVDPDVGGPVRSFDPELWVSPNGRLFLFWAQMEKGRRDAQLGVWCIETSEPDAAQPTWSQPRRIGDGVMMCKPLALSSGEWVLPISKWKEHDNSAQMIVSNDQGKTWSLRGGCNVPKDVRQFDEHMFVERKDGSLWLLVRTTYGIGESVSMDGGKTWPELKPSSILHTPSRFFIRRLASGNLLLVKHGPLDTRTSRSHLTAYLSKDDGHTWTGGLMLDERLGVSYPDGQQTPDGLIRIIYDYNRVSDRNILMASFREEDIAAGKDVSGAVKLRQLVSKATGGQEKPKTSTSHAVADNNDGKPIRITKPGTLTSTDAKPLPLLPGAKLFTDRAYIAAEVPVALRGTHFLPIAMNGQKTLKCERPGTVFFLTPVLARNRDTAAQGLMDQGFEKVALPEVPLFNPASPANFCTLFQKDCAAGETILIGKWAVPVFALHAADTPKAKPNPDQSAGIDPDDGSRPRPDKATPPKLIANPGSTADYNRAKRTCTGVPSIAVSRAGRLWAAWFSGTTPGEIIERCPNAYVVVSTSGDGGKTWKEVLAIDPDGPGPLKAYDPHPWIAPDGKLWVFFTLPYPLHKHAWAITAEDGDQASPAWSSPRPVFEGVLLNKPTVLANGDWLFPFYARRPENMGAILSQVTRDQGRTFTVKGQMLASWDLFPSEPMAVERKDGSLWMLVRTAKGIGESLSTDSGATWSPLKTPAIPHTPSRFFIGRLQSGNLLLVKHLGIAEDPLSGGKAKQRRELTAFLSTDDGKTWSGGLVLDERVGCSHPDAQQAADGTVYFCWDYQRSREQELWMTTFCEEDVLAANDEATARVKSNRRLISKGGTPE